MEIKKEIYQNILNSYFVPPPEQGGILGMEDGVICEYYHDDACTITEKAIYEPDVDVLNKTIEKWDERGIQFAGIVHSHITGQDSLSSGDKEYIHLLFSVLPDSISEVYFPIVIPELKLMLSYIVKRKNECLIIQQDEIHIID